MMVAWFSKELRVGMGGRVLVLPVWAMVLALLGILFFCRLGMWQLSRAAEKELLTSRYEAHATLPVVSLSAVSEYQQVADRRVQVDGRWDNSRLVYLENQMRGPQAGFHVYTVFIPKEGAQAILVNRGWVPVLSDIQRLPSVSLAQTTRITGSLAYPSAFFTVGEPDYVQRPLRVARLDMDRISRSLGVQLYPFVLRLDASEPDGFVREWAPASRLGMLPEKHRAYAFQWFSLALAVVVVLIAVNVRKKEDVEV